MNPDSDQSDLPWQQLMRWEQGALPAPDEARATALRLPVQLGDQWLDVPLMAVERILDAPVIRPLPGSDEALMGYCNLDGQALPVWQALKCLNQPINQSSKQLAAPNAAGAENPVYLLSHWGGSRVLAVDAIGPPFSEYKAISQPAQSKLLSDLKLDLPSRPQELT